MRLRSLLTAVVLTVAALVPSTAATAAATAAPPAPHAEPSEHRAGGVAYNTRTLELRFPAPAGASSCKVRTIDLDRGDYRWQRETWMVLRDPQEIYLAGGEYTWTDCLHQWWGTPSPYVHQSAITNNATGSQVRLANYRIPNAAPGIHTWLYGSSLEPLTCVVC
jgi:hypothetical protein